MKKLTIPSYELAEKKSNELMRELNVEHWNCWAHCDRREGKKPGYRVTVTRLLDGVTKTAFVADSEVVS